MIQRIQTVFLLISAVLSALLLKLNLITAINENGSEVVFAALNIVVTNADGVSASTSTLPLAVLIAVATMLILISIFLFKKRMLQVRFSIYNIALMVGVLGVTWFFFHSIQQSMILNNLQYGVALSFPLINIILLVLAIRLIRRDESLVKAMDRLR